MGLSSHPNTTDSIRSHRPTSVGFLFLKHYPVIFYSRSDSKARPVITKQDLSYPLFVGFLLYKHLNINIFPLILWS